MVLISLQAACNNVHVLKHCFLPLNAWAVFNKKLENVLLNGPKLIIFVLTYKEIAKIWWEAFIMERLNGNVT